MKKDYIILTTLAGAIILILVINYGSTIDVQLHDIYFAIDNLSLAILIVGPLTFMIFLVLGLIRRFRIPSTNIGFITGLLFIALIAYRIYLFQIGYRDQIQSDSELSANENVYNNLNSNIMMTFVVLGICLVGAGIAGFRTYNILASKKYVRQHCIKIMLRPTA